MRYLEQPLIKKKKKNGKAYASLYGKINHTNPNMLYDASAGNRTRGWPSHSWIRGSLRWQRPILPLNHQCWYDE